MAPDERAMLRAVNQSGLMFNSAKARVLGPASTPGPNGPVTQGPDTAADANGARGAAFVRYSVPALELRRLLAEARALNESFRLVYTVLPGLTGDEAWRRAAAGRTVTLNEDGRGMARCTVACAHALLGPCDCAPTELARLPPPGWLASKVLVQQAYPILDEAQVGDELPCFGP